MAQFCACRFSPQNPFLGAKTSLLTLPTLSTITFLPYQLLLLSLLLFFCQLFLLYFLWPNIWNITSSGSSKPFSILHLLFLFSLLQRFLSNTKIFVKEGRWRPGFQMYIGVKLTWSAITSSSNVRIILPLPGQKFKIGCNLLPPSSRIPPCFAGSNLSRRWKMSLSSLLLLKNSKTSFAKV